MKIEFKKVEPNLRSIEKELIFTLTIQNTDRDKMPIKIWGELLSEDGFKIGNLLDTSGGISSWQYLNAEGNKTLDKVGYTFDIKLSCSISDKAINHIEKYRLNKKGNTKDVIFKTSLSVESLEGNISLVHLHLGQKYNDTNKEATYVYYQYVGDYNAQRTNLWTLSANGGTQYLIHHRYLYGDIFVQLTLMEWINTYCPYLHIGDFIVFEFLQPDTLIFSKTLNARYVKAQEAIAGMRKQLNYGEWKQAIIASRPVFELFKNFDDFKKFLLANGYTEDAYTEFKKSIQGFFGLLSKFYHALDATNSGVNPEIPVEKEDAYFAYSYSVSLLHLVSQKLKRNPA